jgi:hypothetical protein
MERGIERTLFHVKQLIRDTFDVEDDAKTVHGAEMRKTFKNQKIESALQIVLCHVLNTLDVDGKKKITSAYPSCQGENRTAFRYSGQLWR